MNLALYMFIYYGLPKIHPYPMKIIKKSLSNFTHSHVVMGHRTNSICRGQEGGT